jgi:hypothetical protein
VEDDGGCVRRVDVVESLEGAGFHADDRSIQNRVDGEFDIAGGEGAAVVKAGVGAEVKDPGLRVGSFPAGGEEGLKAEVLVAANEGVEEERVDVLGLGIGANARIEAGGARFDQHGDGVRVLIFGAAKNQGTGNRQQATEESADSGYRIADRREAAGKDRASLRG